MVFSVVFNIISVISQWTVHLSMLSWSSLLTTTLHNILSKPLAAFPHNNCWNNEQPPERKESCCYEYHQSLERILAKPTIEQATSCSQVHVLKEQFLLFPQCFQKTCMADTKNQGLFGKGLTFPKLQILGSPNWKSLQKTILNVLKMMKSPPNG